MHEPDLEQPDSLWWVLESVPRDSCAQTQRSLIKNGGDAAIDAHEAAGTTAACGANETRADRRQQQQVWRCGKREYDSSPRAGDSDSFAEEPRHGT